MTQSGAKPRGRPRLPRYRVAVTLTYEIAARDELEALARGDALERALRARFDTAGRLARLPGTPALLPQRATGAYRQLRSAATVASRRRSNAGNTKPDS